MYDQFLLLFVELCIFLGSAHWNWSDSISEQISRIFQRRIYLRCKRSSYKPV